MSHPAPKFDPRHVDPASIEALLRAHYPGVRVAAVEVVERSACGDGIASTADRLRLGLRYAGGAAALPEKMILKTLLLSTAFRFGLPTILSLATATRAAEAVPLLGPAARSLLFVMVGLYQRHGSLPARATPRRPCGGPTSPRPWSAAETRSSSPASSATRRAAWSSRSTTRSSIP